LGWLGHKYVDVHGNFFVISANEVPSESLNAKNEELNDLLLDILGSIEMMIIQRIPNHLEQFSDVIRLFDKTFRHVDLYARPRPVPLPTSLVVKNEYEVSQPSAIHSL